MPSSKVVLDASRADYGTRRRDDVRPEGARAVTRRATQPISVTVDISGRGVGVRATTRQRRVRRHSLHRRVLGARTRCAEMR